MDIAARLQLLFAELGQLDLDIRGRERRRAAIIAEAEVLNRLAAEIAAAQRGAANAPIPTSDVNAGPDRTPALT